MNCERARELFSNYIESDLDNTLSDLVREHMDSCVSCKREFDLFRQAWNGLISMPEVKVPSNLRHDVLMRMARMQHQQRQSTRQIIPTLDLDYIFKRLFPPKAVALACMAAVLAIILLRVPETTYNFVSSKLNPTIVPSIDTKQTEKKANVDGTPLEQSQKTTWQNRKLGRNTVWTKIDREERGDGMALYRITLSLNRSAVLDGDDTARIGARVHLLPPGDYNPKDLTAARVVWDGNILRGPGVQIPLIVDETQERGGVVTLLVDWRFRGREHAQVVYIPAQKKDSSDAMLGLQMDQKSSDDTIYSALKDITLEYGIPIVANANLDDKPSVMNIGQGTLDQALRNCLESSKLDWLYSDKAVYIDRQYLVEANIP